jgi:hypothetical protein
MKSKTGDNEAGRTNDGAKTSYANTSCPVSYWDNTDGSNNENQERGIYILDILYKVGETCQLILYFERLELDEPTNGYCKDTTLVITGQNKDQFIPTSCGDLAQQHC